MSQLKKLRLFRDQFTRIVNLEFHILSSPYDKLLMY